MGHLFRLSDEQWAAIEPHLAKIQPGARRVDERRVLSGIIHVLRTCGRWRDCHPAKLSAPRCSGSNGSGRKAVFRCRIGGLDILHRLR